MNIIRIRRMRIRIQSRFQGFDFSWRNPDPYRELSVPDPVPRRKVKKNYKKKICN